MENYDDNNPLADKTSEELIKMANRLQQQLANILEELEYRSIDNKVLGPVPIPKKKPHFFAPPTAEIDELEKKLANAGTDVDNRFPIDRRPLKRRKLAITLIPSEPKQEQNGN